ncbi:DNA-binding transcriptional LysR family regulator [Microbacterium resistens]|uniref:DNA-binding transcriptional LysR family regulator n=1 Tax=Microbacterium resistens TaxID=156977 RepID=A0ABU1SJ20_9MICO|nr:LysR family transcriptional regulator [Microbacterium resistens]MDR6869003.1 DNA-binding transcriptional LysR family regulator [Microbacterium resistens]
MIDLLGLRILVVLEDEGTVTATAARLGYTPSNITQHLRRIEGALGAPMVERVGRRVVLTERARGVVARGRRLVLELDDLAATTMSGTAGTIDVAAFPTALRGLLVPAMAALAREHPELIVRPHELEPAAALDAVRSGRMQAAIVKTWGEGEGIEDPMLTHVPLGTDPIDVLVPTADPLARAESLVFTDLRDRSWALTPEGEPSYRDWLVSHQKVLTLRPRRIYEAGEFDSLMSFVAHGLAIAAIPRLGRGPLPDGVTAIPLRDRNAHRRISLAVRRTSRGAATIDATRDALRAVVWPGALG